MEHYNYFYIEDLTQKASANEYPYHSFLSEVEAKHYPTAFYLYELETLLIRTKDTQITVLSHIEEVISESCKQQNIPRISYKMHDADKLTFRHPHLDWEISAEELYEYTASLYRYETGIDLLCLS